MKRELFYKIETRDELGEHEPMIRAYTGNPDGTKLSMGASVRISFLILRPNQWNGFFPKESN